MFKDEWFLTGNERQSPYYSETPSMDLCLPMKSKQTLEYIVLLHAILI